MPNAPAANISLYVGARAAVNTPVSACASGNEAISLALDQIRLGRADIVLAGGTEAAIHPLPMAAFANMMAPVEERRATRPRSRGRGTPAATASCSARVPASSCSSRRSTPGPAARRIYAEVLGAGITADAHDIAQPDPAGRGGARAIVRALEEAEISASDIAHINAHATSTPQGDIAEGLMIHATLGSHADEVVVTSTKSMTGHLLGGGRRAGGDRHHPGDPPPGQPADDQPRRQGPPGRARHPHVGPRPAVGRHRGPQQLLRLRRRQRRRRVRERCDSRPPPT